MFLRAVSLCATLAIVAYMMVSILGKDSKVDKAVDSNATVQEQKKALQNAGVNANDKEALKKQVDGQAKALEQYQQQSQGLTGEP
ncbi:MAG TPA: hypothetical protein VEF76_14850 [Patescibacteria group bacterium]|nr:hypothetical protein [Patescibacteria group bacterium]